MAESSPSRAAASAPLHPDFDPVPVRGRKDGWTADRQRAFILELRRTRRIGAAARIVGMSRESAYRLRDRPGAAGFASAWDAALAAAPARRRGATSTDALWHRALYGIARPIVRGGREVAVVVKPDNRALLKLLRRFDRLSPVDSMRERSQRQKPAIPGIS